jgi:CHAT domain-containing protein
VVPSGNLEQVDPPGEEVRILPVVGQARNARLGRVDYSDVLTSIKEAETRPGFSMLEPVLQATTDGLRAAVSSLRPHVVHFMGHGRFRDDRGAVALSDSTGATGDTADIEWVEESRLARTLCPDDWSPALVVLHACEGGAVDFEERFAGLAPTLAQEGALCVIAMQYAVTNSTAVAFSTAMYAALAQGRSLDEAVQDARRAIWVRTADPRLIGVPMIYQRTAQPLLAVARQEG